MHIFDDTCSMQSMSTASRIPQSKTKSAHGCLCGKLERLLRKNATVVTTLNRSSAECNDREPPTRLILGKAKICSIFLVLISVAVSPVNGQVDILCKVSHYGVWYEYQCHVEVQPVLQAPFRQHPFNFFAVISLDCHSYLLFAC